MNILSLVFVPAVILYDPVDGFNTMYEEAARRMEFQALQF